MTLKKSLKLIGQLMVCIGLLGLLIGCGSVLQEQKKESPTATPAPPPVGKRIDRPEGRYYDFEDIQIPNELKLDSRSSRVFQSANLTAGVLTFDAYVEVKSLINFFKDSMAKDNWQLKGNFKLPPKTVLLFEKKNKRALFFIEESMLNTRLEIWMIPTQDA
jgi:hypothetical protein